MILAAQGLIVVWLLRKLGHELSSDLVWKDPAGTLGSVCVLVFYGSIVYVAGGLDRLVP